MKPFQTFLFLFFIFFIGKVYAQTPAKKDDCACCSPAHRQFDFWLGDWEATANGKVAGTNKIVLLQDKCIVQENWISSTPNYTGTSYNFYNKNLKKWQQVWIDNQGSNLILTGELIGNQMILKSETLTNPKGEKYQNRITWTNHKDGTVRQYWEVTKDEGKTWNSIFDGLYKKKK